MGMSVFEDYGGLGIDFFSYVVVVEEIVVGDGVCLIIMLVYSFVCGMIGKYVMFE